MQKGHTGILTSTTGGKSTFLANCGTRRDLPFRTDFEGIMLGATAAVLDDPDESFNAFLKRAEESVPEDEFNPLEFILHDMRLWSESRDLFEIYNTVEDVVERLDDLCATERSGEFKGQLKFTRPQGEKHRGLWLDDFNVRDESFLTPLIKDIRKKNYEHVYVVSKMTIKLI
jgi:hypothetical protein